MRPLGIWERQTPSGLFYGDTRQPGTSLNTNRRQERETSQPVKRADKTASGWFVGLFVLGCICLFWVILEVYPTPMELAGLMKEERSAKGGSASHNPSSVHKMSK